MAGFLPCNLGGSVDYEQELAAEQSYFDYARDVREAKRHGRVAPAAAASGKDASLITKERREHAMRMRPPSEAPAFGRIDLDDGDTYYIGYDSIIDPDTQEVLVVNWKTKIGELYSRAEATDPHGVGRKRIFDCDEHKIVEFADYVFADLAARIGTLAEEPQFDDALLTELNRTRTGEMQDVVKTIQASQTPIMRAPLEGVLLVQGAPGTGKTVVALHRVSWLLYQYSDRLTADRVLVIGPNPTFTRYIRGVLPALGDRDVRQVDINGIGPAVRLGRSESHAVTVLKGQPRIAGLLTRGLWQRIGLPSGPEALTLRVAGQLVTFDRRRLDDRLHVLTAATAYMEGRRQFRTFLIEEIQRAVRVATSEFRAELVDNLLERIWPQYTAVSFLQGFFASRDRLLQAAGHEFTAQEITMLQRRQAERLSDETWSTADIFLLDELDSLLNGVAPQDQYGHVVVDEAQDLSPMQLRAIARRAATGSMTIVGDIAQSTGPWARDSWDEVLEHLPVDSVTRTELEYGYRVPRQIFDLAARLLPRIAPDLTPPRVVRDGPAEPEYIPVDSADLANSAVDAAMRHAGFGRSVGVIATAQHRESLAAIFHAREVDFVDASTGQLGGSINLVSPVDAKGLEFDVVVVVEPEDIVTDAQGGERMLYVALTRSTKYLTVVHAGAALPLVERTVRDEEVEQALGFIGEQSANAPGRRGRRAREPVNRPRPSRLVLAIARDLADQVQESLAEDSWEVAVVSLLDELERRRHPQHRGP
jgi:DNA helicase IV